MNSRSEDLQYVCVCATKVRVYGTGESHYPYGKRYQVQVSNINRYR